MSFYELQSELIMTYSTFTAFVNIFRQKKKRIGEGDGEGESPEGKS